MKKRIGLLSVLWMMTLAFPAWGARKMSVDQLQQTITAALAVHRSDDAVAQQLADVKLTARLDSLTLQSLLAARIGSHTSRALRALADESIFLDPPPSQILAKPAPDVAAQKAILGQTVHYVARTLPKLPDFMATRVTEYYNDSPRPGEAEGPMAADGLYLVGTYQAPISFHDGSESDNPALLLQASRSSRKKDTGSKSASSGDKAPTNGMSSWGEFGPVLGIVLVDAAKGKLSWERWELDNVKPVAVYQFSVARAVSHYNVRYCCVPADEVVNGHYVSKGSRTTKDIDGGGMVQSAPSTPVSDISAYHGHLTVDPETGVVLRITIEADPQPDDPIQRAAMMVEYAPVAIGEGSYYCPVRSVSLSTSQQAIQATPMAAVHTVFRRYLNDVVFTGYRRFGSEATLITDIPPETEAANPETLSATPQPATTSAVAVFPSAPLSPSAASPKPDAASGEVATAPTFAALPTPAVAAEEKEIAIQPAENLPGLTAEPDSATAVNGKGAFTLKATARLVDVSLVAFDKSGKPVTDLKRDEIEMYDNGRRQQIAAFHHVGLGTPFAGAQAAAPGVFTNAAPQASQSGQSSEEAPDLLILLIDESHLASSDLAQAHSEMLRFLKATRPDAKLALYSIGDHGFRVIQDVTQDHLLMTARLAAWTPDASAVAQTRKLERRQQQKAQNLQDAKDLHGLNVVMQGDILDAFPLGDPDLATLGNNPLRASLEGMTALARHFASVPGHKSLAWISGDQALAGLPAGFANSEAGKRSDLQLEPAMAHTREALNDAHIALYVVDASMPTLVGGGLDAARYSPGRESSAAGIASQGPGGGGPTLGQSDIKMQVDLAGIQAPLRSLALSTGGRAIARGDLVKALDSIQDESKALYEVAFDPDTPADGNFHTLQINIPGRKNIKLRYRTGYQYNEESDNSQQRFQQAVWSPQDASAIKLTAEVAVASDPASGTHALNLHVAFPGLALEEKDGRWRDQLFIFIARRDEATQKAELSGDTLRLALTQTTYDSGVPAGIPYQRIIEPGSKLSSIRILVVDSNSGRIGSVTIPESALSDEPQQGCCIDPDIRPHSLKRLRSDPPTKTPPPKP